MTKKELREHFKDYPYSIKDYSRGQIIRLENENYCSLDILLQGKVSAQKIDEDGNILQVAQFLSGDFFGANLLFSSRSSSPMTIVAESPSSIIRLSKEFIISLSQTNSKFLMSFLRAISDRSLVLTDKIESMSLKTIREKIFDYLKYEYSIRQNPRIVLSFSKKELAERLGVQRTSLSRELAKMRDDGLIDFDAKSITIKDLEKIN